MKFVTHKILNPAGNSVQWEEWLAKTAAEAKPGIGLDGDDGEGKGQVINTEGEEAMTNFKDPKPEEDGGKAKSSKDKGEKTAKITKAAITSLQNRLAAYEPKGVELTFKKLQYTLNEAQKILKQNPNSNAQQLYSSLSSIDGMEDEVLQWIFTELSRSHATDDFANYDFANDPNSVQPATPPTTPQAPMTASVKKAGCGKEMGECSDAGKVTEKHTEACPGDPQNPEPKTLINNDPNYQKTKGGAKGKDKKEDAVAKVVQKFQKVSSMDRLDKIILFASLSSNKNYPIEYVEAMTGIKVANLTAEEKTWFKDFWLTMYPAEYVDQMIKDR